MARGFLDEIMASRTSGNPDFPRMVQEAIAQQDAARQTPPERDQGEEATRITPQPLGRRRAIVEHRVRKTPV